MVTGQWSSSGPTLLPSENYLRQSTNGTHTVHFIVSHIYLDSVNFTSSWRVVVSDRNNNVLTLGTTTRSVNGAVAEIHQVLSVRFVGLDVFALIRPEFTFGPDAPSFRFSRYNFASQIWEDLGCPSDAALRFSNSQRLWSFERLGGITRLISFSDSDFTFREWTSTQSCWVNLSSPSYVQPQVQQVVYVKSHIFVLGVQGLPAQGYLLEYIPSSQTWYDHASRVTFGMDFQNLAAGPGRCLNGLFGDDCTCTQDRGTAQQVCQNGYYILDINSTVVIIEGLDPIVLAYLNSTWLSTFLFTFGGNGPAQIITQGCLQLAGKITLEVDADNLTPEQLINRNVWTLFQSNSSCLYIDDNLWIDIDTNGSCVKGSASAVQSVDQFSVSVLFDSSGCETSDDGLAKVYIGVGTAAVLLVLIIILGAVLWGRIRARAQAVQAKRTKKRQVKSLNFIEDSSSSEEEEEEDVTPSVTPSSSPDLESDPS